MVFMDIQLADGLSFEIFQKVEIDAPIIFTTAFDQYAIQAFKVNSVDYLLKPIQKEDLDAALNKFTKANKPASINSDILKQLLGSIQKPKKRSGILVKEGSGFIQVDISHFLYFYSEDSITFGITKNKRLIIEETIDQLYASLDQDEYYKINRGQIISKRSVVKIDPYFNHRVKLTVSSARDQEFIVSRQKTAEFKGWMNR
ncbi:MAG: two-component system response regulator LytT [Saprospiraceae bacterium]